MPAPKRILIVKLGSTFDDLVHERGDFERWAQEGMGLPNEACRTVRAAEGEALPDPGRFAGIVLTGSHSDVNDREPWSEAVAQWLGPVVQAQTPVLGICYGHQLLACAAGGTVGDNPNGLEFGTTEVALHEQAQADPLFKGLPDPLSVQVTHAQSVVAPPPGSVVLASNAHDPCQAYRVGPCAWGVQFHPEFAPAVVRAYIRESADTLSRQGRDPEALAAGVSETPDCASLLARFAQFTTG